MRTEWQPLVTMHTRASELVMHFLASLAWLPIRVSSFRWNTVKFAPPPAILQHPTIVKTVNAF